MEVSNSFPYLVTVAPPGGLISCQSRWDAKGRLEISLTPRIALELHPVGASKGSFEVGGKVGEFELVTANLVRLFIAPTAEAYVRVGLDGGIYFSSASADDRDTLLRALTGQADHARSSWVSAESASASVAAFVDRVRSKSAFEQVRDALRKPLPNAVTDQRALLAALKEVLAFYRQPLETRDHLDAPLGGLAGEPGERIANTTLRAAQPWARLAALADLIGPSHGTRLRRLSNRLELEDDVSHLGRLLAALTLATLRPPDEAKDAIDEALADEKRGPQRSWLEWLAGHTAALDASSFADFPWFRGLTLSDAIVEAALGDAEQARTRIPPKLVAKLMPPTRKTRKSPTPVPDQVAALAILALQDRQSVEPARLSEAFRSLFDWSGAALRSVALNREEAHRSREVPLASLVSNLPFIELLRRTQDPRPPLELVRTWLWPRRRPGVILVGAGECDLDEVNARGRVVIVSVASPNVVKELSPSFNAPREVLEPLLLLRMMLLKQMEAR